MPKATVWLWRSSTTGSHSCHSTPLCPGGSGLRLAPPADLNGWKVDGGKWSVAKDGTVEGKADQGFELYGMPDRKIRPCYEIEADIEFPGESTPGFGAGFVIDPVDSDRVGRTYIYCSKADKRLR